MKAITLSHFGAIDALQMREIPIPTPTAEQLLVKVHATALNRADILQRKGLYPPPAGDSEILGLELAGEIVAWGEQVQGFQQGERVFGLVGGGAYAEYAVIDAQMALRIPDAWSYEFAAAIPEVFMTANETIFELGQLQARESILIQAGASGVGTAAIQMAHAVGATVFVTAGSDEKVKKCLDLGAHHAINYKNTDFYEKIMQLTDKQGVDVIEDFIGASYFERHLKLLKSQGRLIIVALMGGHKTEIPLNLLLTKRLKVYGSVMRSRTLAEKRAFTQRFSQRWLPLLQQGLINPIIDCIIPLAEVQRAHQLMEMSQHFGKIVLKVI